MRTDSCFLDPATTSLLACHLRLSSALADCAHMVPSKEANRIERRQFNCHSQLCPTGPQLVSSPLSFGADVRGVYQRSWEARQQDSCLQTSSDARSSSACLLSWVPPVRLL